MATATIGDIEIYYELHGDGPPLLNIGGSGQTVATSTPAQNPMIEHFTVCFYDQRGLGRTTIPDGQWTMADYADDAAGLLDHLGWGRVPVLGTSFGGMVAQNLAVRHLDHIERLVLCCTSSGGAGGSSADLLALTESGAEPGSEEWLTIIDTRNDPAAGVLAPGMELLDQFADNRAVDPDPERTQRGFLGQLRARSGHDVYDALPTVDVPTLVIGGEHDGIAPPENLRAIAGQLPNAELVFCDGGHLFMLQDPAAWPAIVAFLER